MINKYALGSLFICLLTGCKIVETAAKAELDARIDERVEQQVPMEMEQYMVDIVKLHGFKGVSGLLAVLLGHMSWRRYKEERLKNES